MRSHLKPWVATFLLFLLGAVSIAFGALQLSLLGLGERGAQSAMATAHYVSMPVPIIVHIVTGSLFNLLLPLQFARPLRARYPSVHRALGRVCLVCGVGFALSALWMNEMYPAYGGWAKYLGIVAHSGLLLAALFMAIRAIRQGDVACHQRWMMRAAAVALSPATQRIIVIPSISIWGEQILTDAVIGGLIWLGLIVNGIFVEWVAYQGRRGWRRLNSDELQRA